MKKAIGAFLILLSLGLMGWWYLEGANIYTKTARAVEVHDDLFGTASTQWEAHFSPGLEYLGPVVLVLLIIAGWLFVRSAREKRQRKMAQGTATETSVPS